MNTDGIVLLLNVWNMSHYFWMIIWIKNVTNFQIAKSSASGCCLAFAWFFADFSLALLKKVLQKKNVYFTMNIAKFLRTHILKNICERLLLRGLFRILSNIYGSVS